MSSRTKEIKADELLDNYREVRDRGGKVLPQLEGQAKEVLEELVEQTTELLNNAEQMAKVRDLSEELLDEGLERSKDYLKVLATAEEMAAGTMPMPFDKSHLH